MDEIDKIFDSNSFLVVNGGQKEQSKSTWDMLSKGVTSVGASLTKGIQSGGKVAADGITQLGAFLESKITTDAQPLVLSDSTKQSVRAVRDTSGKALEVSGTVAKQIIEMNIQLARMMTNTVVGIIGSDKKPGQDESKDEERERMKEFGRTSLKTTIEVVEQLDLAAITVGRALGQSISRCFEKKYGREASALCDEGAIIADNVRLTYKDIQATEVRTIAKVTAKETVKQVGEQL